MDTYIECDILADVAETDVANRIRDWLKNTRTPRKITVIPVEKVEWQAGKVNMLYSIKFEWAEGCPS